MILFVIYIFLLLCLCILFVCLCIFIVPAGTLRLTEVFPFFCLICKANASKIEHVPHSSKFLFFFYVLFVLCRSLYCFCVNAYCTTATEWLPNRIQQIYHIIYGKTSATRNNMWLFSLSSQSEAAHLTHSHKQLIRLPKRHNILTIRGCRFRPLSFGSWRRRTKWN